MPPEDPPDHSESESVTLDDEEFKVELVKQRCEEWETKHQHVKHEGIRPFFTYRRVVFDDNTEEIWVVCQDCGDSEVVVVAEREGNKLVWAPVRSEGSELN